MVTMRGQAVLLNASEVAKMLGCSLGQVYKFKREGKIKSLGGMKRNQLFSYDAIMEFVHGQQVANVSGPLHCYE